MTDARDLALPTGYRSCWSSSRTGSGQHARRHCGPSTPSSSSCTGPSAEPSWNARRPRHGPAGRRPAGGVPRNEGPVPAHGWSRNVLLNMMMNRSMERTGAAPSNFVQRLVAPDSELAQQVAKDPYNFEFLGLSGEVAERDLENALTNRITETLRELGPGFAFVGRQVHSRSTATTYTSTCSYFTSSSAGTWSLN